MNRALLGRVFLGDWHPVLRDPLDLFRLSFVVGAVVFALDGDAHAASRLLFTGVVVFAARVVDLPRLFDWGFCVAMAFNGWGDALDLFTRLDWYDNVVHVTLPAFVAPMAYIALSRLDVVRPPAEQTRRASRMVGMAVITMCLGVTAASAYEIYEWVVDSWFGQHLFISEGDTVNDLADGFVGALGGGLLMVNWALARYGTRRTVRDRTRSDSVSPSPPRTGSPPPPS